MSDPLHGAQPCFMCGFLIPLAEFRIWPDVPENKYAVCHRCGVPNGEDDTAFVVLNTRPMPHFASQVMSVFPLAHGGWRATCDCGMTEAVATQADGWGWIVEHQCMPVL